MKNENHKLKIAVLIWLYAGALVLSCGKTKTEEREKVEFVEHEEQAHEGKGVTLSREALASIRLQTVLAEKRAVGAAIHVTAVIKPDADRVVHITPRIPGRVTQVFITLGQQVRKGERLLMLDSVELGEAKAAFRKAKARMEVTQTSYDREKRLYEEGRITSEKEMLDAKGNYLEAKAEFEGAEERLYLYGLSQEEIEKIGPEHDPKVSLLPVVSPLSGTVTEKHVTLGELVRPEETICTVVDLSTLWIILNVYEKDISRVRVGQEVAVRVDAYPGKIFRGTLTYVGAVLDETTRTAEARVELGNASGELRPGMFASVDLQTGAPSDVVAVPSEAVQMEGETRFVFVALNDTSFDKRVVKPGRQLDDYVEIVEGLKPGERVVTEGAFTLKSELAKATLGEE